METHPESCRNMFLFRREACVRLTTKIVSKLVVAFSGGGRAFALRIIPGLLVVIGAAWLAAFS